MPLQEVVTNLLPGETVTVVGPGALEFQAAPKVVAATKAMAGKGVAVAGTAGAAGTVVAGGQGGAGAVPASLSNGKVLGLSLGTWNPWVLMAVGAVGSYLYFKKKNSGLGRFWP